MSIDDQNCCNVIELDYLFNFSIENISAQNGIDEKQQLLQFHNCFTTLQQQVEYNKILIGGSMLRYAEMKLKNTKIGKRKITEVKFLSCANR
jgi:hypothetical protein